MSIRTKNILTAVLALVLVGGFIFVAEGLKKDDKDDRLAAIDQATTTTVERTTTTREPTTTTSTTLVPAPTTTAGVTATTTAPRTATTRRSTTATTRRSSPTTAGAPARPAPPFNGAGTESTGNTGSFVRNADDSVTGAAPPACSEGDRSDPFCFNVGWVNASGKFRVTIRNNTARTMRFPGDGPTADGLKIRLKVNRPTGTVTEFVLDASSVKTLASGEGLIVESLPPSTLTTDNGEYTFTATCEVDYGS